jgi:phosphoglycerate dehydrogenase-like enzyme
MGKTMVTIAGTIPYDKAPDLTPVYDALRDEFDTRFIEANEKAMLEAAEERPETEVVVIPWTPDPLVTDAVLDRLPSLKAVISTYGGVKRNVAVDHALRRGVRLTCTGAVRARSVAEFTMALMMDGLLFVSRTHHDMRSGERFPRYGYTRELTGRTVGIVGFGAVTRELITMLEPFNTTVLVYSKHAAEEETMKWGAQKVSLTDLAGRSEVVVLLTGLTDETHHIIDGTFLSLMQEGALLVNTARGKLIDEAALIAELRSGRISAALDVYEEEPLALDSPLRSMDNAVVTAHSANSTREMDVGRWRFALSELRGYVSQGRFAGELDADHIARMSDD